MNFHSIQAAREYLLRSGYRFVCYGAMTQAEMYAKDGAQTVAIRRKGRGVVVG